MPDDSNLPRGGNVLFPLSKDTTTYRKITSDYVSVSSFEGEEVLKV